MVIDINDPISSGQQCRGYVSDVTDNRSRLICWGIGLLWLEKLAERKEKTDVSFFAGLSFFRILCSRADLMLIVEMQVGVLLHIGVGLTAEMACSLHSTYYQWW